MALTVLCVLMGAAIAASVQVGYVPAASSYIYRNDNNGPANFIQLGAPYHGQLNTVISPVPLIQPKIEALEAYDLAPVPLPYIAAKPIAVLDAEEDDDDDDDDEEEIVGGHGAGYENGGGSDYGEEHHRAHGEKGAKGYKSEGHHAKGAHGHYNKQHDEGSYAEANGGKKGHHSEASAHGKHYSKGGSYKGGDHGHKKHFSKGEDVTGYHKVFNKDEFKKDHDFYDVADKSGHFNKHGYQKGHHGSEKSGHKEGGHHGAAYDKGEFGKSGHHSKGHIDDDDKSHSAEEGHESQYNQEEGYGKKGGSSHGKDYGFEEDDYDDDKE